MLLSPSTAPGWMLLPRTRRASSLSHRHRSQRYIPAHRDPESGSTSSASGSDDSDDSSSTSSASNSSTEYSSDEELEEQPPGSLSNTTKRIFAVIITLFLVVAFVLLFKTATEPAASSNTSTRPTNTPSEPSSSREISTPSPSLAPPSATNASRVSRILPEKLRGVNLGSLFILEPWMAGKSWDKLGCSEFLDEWTCNESRGLGTMQPLWENHWNSFYSAADFEEMAKLGLNSAWGAGDPTAHIDTDDKVFYDDHNYAQWIVTEKQTTEEYLSYACTNTRPTDLKNTITGEWSLSTIGITDGLDDAFYRDFFAKQVANFERGSGWFFWSWKTELDSPQWGFQQAAAAGYVSDLGKINSSVCNDFKR
ncbi:hypothetical protein JCM16303_004177 [Sporobolomyces ruberrimus]